MYSYRKKNIIMIVMMVAVLFMAVGYALLSTTLNINGTSDLTGSWGVQITNVSYEATGKAYNINEPTYTDTTVKFNVGVKTPGDKMTFSVTIQNFGNIDALLTSIDASATGTEEIIYSINGITNQEILKGGATKTFTVSTYFDINATELPLITTKDLTVKLNYVQYDDQTLNPVPPVVEDAVLTTLSGNNTLTLDSAAPFNLVNYKIIGNSVQNGTPSPNSPVEIQSVGEKTKNLFDVGKVDEYFTNLTNLSVDENPITGTNSITGTVENSWAGSHIYKLTNYSSGQYYIKFEGLISDYARFMIRCFDSNGTQLDDSSISISNLVYNTYYKGWLSYSPALLVNIPETVSYWQIGFSFVGNENEIGTTRTINNIQITKSSTPTEYEPYGYKIPIKLNGKNVYSNGDMSYTGSYSLTLSNPIKAGIYTISALFNNDSDIYNYGLLFYGTQTTIFGNLRYDKGERTSKTVTFNEDITRLVFYATSAGSTNAGVNASFTDIQIEEGTEATEYEPYVEPKTYNIYLDEPLRRIGDYADYIDFENQKVVRSFNKVDLGTLTWYTGQYTAGYYAKISQNAKSYSAIELPNSISDISKVQIWNGTLDTYAFAHTTNMNEVYFKVASIYTLEQWQELTQGHYLIYQLDTEDDTETIKLPNIYIPKGNSVLSVDSNGIDVPIEARYYKQF